MTVTSVAIIGAGLMARTHIEALATSPSVQIQAICAPRSEASNALAAAVSARLVEDYDRVLSDDSIAAIDLCVPTEIHRQYGVAALQAGKHVLIEKPLALTLEDAQAIAAVAAKSDKVAMTALVLRFWPAYRTALDLVRRGAIGVPQLINAQRLSPPPSWNTWMRDHSRSGGPVVDLMIHDLDFVTEVLGAADTVSGVAASGLNHACVMSEHLRPAALAEAESPAVSIVEGSWMLAPSQPLQSRFMIIGTEGNLAHSFTAGTSPVPGTSSVPGTESLTLYPTAGDPQHFAISDANPYALQLEYFFECIRTGRAPDRSSIAAGVSALALALAAKQAVQR